MVLHNELHRLLLLNLDISCNRSSQITPSRRTKRFLSGIMRYWWSQAITRFRQRGGGILTARDHQDLASSLCSIGGIGAAHFFHTRNPDPDTSRCSPDDTETKSISWPNYHSGRNGDYQIVEPVLPVHELLRKPDGRGTIAHFPASA